MAKTTKEDEVKPIIIIKKVKKVAGGHHGGAWKVAYADFVTAMMAFFLLLWLLNVVTSQALQTIFMGAATALNYNWGNQVGSLEKGKEATLLLCDGDLLDIRTHVLKIWIGGKEVSLESRHTRLYEKYKARPKP